MLSICYALPDSRFKLAILTTCMGPRAAASAAQDGLVRCPRRNFCMLIVVADSQTSQTHCQNCPGLGSSKQGSPPASTSSNQCTFSLTDYVSSCDQPSSGVCRTSRAPLSLQYLPLSSADASNSDGFIQGKKNRTPASSMPISLPTPLSSAGCRGQVGER